jgi:hypothetical protein
VSLPRYKPASQEHWVGVIRCVRYPTLKDRMIRSHRYEIEPEGESLTVREPCVLVHQCDLRLLERAITHLCLPKSNNKAVLTCISNMKELKFDGTDLDRRVSTNDIKQHEWTRWESSQGTTGNTPRSTPCLPISGASPLLPLSCVGIDTCSALSVSTERQDFTFLDESLAARESVSCQRWLCLRLPCLGNDQTQTLSCIKYVKRLKAKDLWLRKSM